MLGWDNRWPESSRPEQEVQGLPFSGELGLHGEEHRPNGVHVLPLRLRRQDGHETRHQVRQEAHMDRPS